MKKIVIALIVCVVAFVIVIAVVGRTFYPDNVAETAPDGGKKGLETRYYDADAETVRKHAKEAVGTLSTWGASWRLVDETDGGSVSTIRAEVPVVVFTDELVVTIKDEGGKSRVDVRSASRVGKSDFGENARHVRKFLAALDQRVRKR